MKQDGKEQKRQGKKSKKLQLYKPRKKKSVEEDAAIQYLQAQYDKVTWFSVLYYEYLKYILGH